VRALDETEIDGVPSTRELAIEVLRSEPFARGEYSTSTLAELRVPA
jgi:biotin carboxylase